MIQKWIKNQLEIVIPNLEWTMDFKTGSDHTGVVYNETPGNPTKDDFEILFPTYSVEIESSDMQNAEVYAWKVYDALNKRRQEHAVIMPGELEFEIIFIQPIPPILMGIENKKLSYSINLQTTVRKIKTI